MPGRVVATSTPATDTFGDSDGGIGLLLGVALDLSGDHDLDVVLGRIVQGAATVAGARYAALASYDADGQMTRFVHHGMDDDTVRRLGELPVGRGLMGELVVADGPIRLANISDHAQSVGLPPGHPPMRTFLGVPVARGGRRHGNLYVTEKVGHLGFNDDDEALVVFLAALASGAIDSALLVESERTRTEAVAARAAAEERERTRRETLGKVIEAQEAERARVSRDLHDDIGQALTSVLLGLRLVDANVHDPTGDIGETRRRLDDLRGLATDALRRSRQLAFNLRPTVLDDIGLVPALERLTTDLAAGSGLTIELIDQLPDGDRLPPAIETAAYRVTQEALTNVVRHAHASAARVILTNVGNSVQVVVSDDGRGFDVETQPQGLGLAGMAERVALAGGQLTVSARLGYGTTVMFEAPVG